MEQQMSCGEVEIREVTWLEAEDQLRLIRTQVFIVEQGVPEDMEWDGFDSEAVHLLAVLPDGTVAGTVRLLEDGHVGRMAVVNEWRNRGVGRALLATVLDIASKKGVHRIVLNAQTSALGFYEKVGFQRVGGEFLDAGIPHYRMIYRR